MQAILKKPYLYYQMQFCSKYGFGFAIICMVMAFSPLSAQNDGPAIRFSFLRQNNFTYSSQSFTDHEQVFGKYRIQVRLSHDVLMNVNRPQDPFVQLYLGGQIWQYFDFSSRWSAVSWFEMDQFFSAGNRRYSLYFGASYKPHESVEIIPLAGYSWDFRGPILDQGLSPALLFRSRHNWGNGLEMDTRLWFRTKQIAPRHQRNFSFFTLWNRSFGEFASLSFGLEGGSNELNDYKLNSIERIVSDTVAPVFGIRYKLLPGLTWESDNRLRLSRRSFRYNLFSAIEPEFNDLRYNQLEVFTSQQISFRKKLWDGFFRYQFEYFGRRYELENSMFLPELSFRNLEEQEAQKDYFRNQTLIEFQLNYRPGRHQFSFSGNNRYLKYDTPSEENFDDHDELNYGLGLSWQSRWSRKFSTRYTLSGNRRQYAFLFKERSQDNYSQWVARMEFGFAWEILKTLRLEGAQFVYATYNVKDFEDRNLTDRSTRNLESKLELQFRPKAIFQSRISLYRREAHVSYLNWEAFSETTLDTTRTTILEWNNAWTLPLRLKKASLFFDSGYKHFLLSRFQNTAMTDLGNTLVPINLQDRTFQTGPLTGLRLKRRDRSSVELLVWWQYQLHLFDYEEIPSLTTLLAAYKETDLLKRQTDFRPFIDLKLSWYFR
jgi:hypothetical protein